MVSLTLGLLPGQNYYPEAESVASLLGASWTSRYCSSLPLARVSPVAKHTSRHTSTVWPTSLHQRETLSSCFIQPLCGSVERRDDYPRWSWPSSVGGLLLSSQRFVSQLKITKISLLFYSVKKKKHDFQKRNIYLNGVTIL